MSLPSRHTLIYSLLLVSLLYSGQAAAQSSPNLSYDDFMSRLGEAKVNQKPVLLFLASEASAVSKKIDSDILANPGPDLKKSMDAYVLARVNGATSDGKQVQDAYGWNKLPIMAILNSDGEVFSILDLSNLSEQLINSGTPKQLSSWLDKNTLRFQRHGPRGYEQCTLATNDPIYSVISEWNKVKENYKKELFVFLLNDGRKVLDGKNSIKLHHHMIEYVGKTDTVQYCAVPISLWQPSASFKLNRARVITPDLKENKVEPFDIEESTGYLNESQYNHVRTETIVFPGVKEGCLIESDWEIDAPSQMSNQAAFIWSISQRGCSTLHSHAEFSAPSSTDPQSLVIRNSGKVSTNTQNGITTLIFDGRSEHDQPSKDFNDRDLPVSEEVIFATRNSWDEIGKWFLTLCNSLDCRVHSREFDQWVSDIIKDVEKGPGYERRAANAILKSLRKNFRYLALEMRESGCQPHPVAETLKNKCGDCKDLSLFLQEALLYAGIKSHLVLLNSQTIDPLDLGMPATELFNHVIVQINTPEGEIYADPASFLGVGILPPQDCSKQGLLCSDGKSEIITLPAWDEKMASCLIESEFKSLTKKPTPAHIDFTYAGFSKYNALRIIAGNWGSVFHKRESTLLKDFFTDFEVIKSSKLSDNEEPDPLKISMDAKISGVVHSSEDSVSVTPCFFVKNEERLPYHNLRRKSDELTIISGDQSSPLKEIVKYPLPTGFICTPPADIHVDNPYFKVDRSYDTNCYQLSITTSIVRKVVPGPSRYVRDSELAPEARNLSSRLVQPVIIKKTLGQILRDACAGGDRGKVVELLKQGVSVEEADDKGNTPLIIASKAGKTDIVQTLIAAKANLEARNNEDENALVEAIAADRTETALALISAGADINATMNHDNLARPINYAAARGNITILTKLLDAGADINSNSGEGTPIYLAVQYKRLDAVKYLLTKTPDLSILPLKSKQFYLDNPPQPITCFPIIDGSIDMLTLLLESGADPNASNIETGCTPLYIAAGWGNSSAVKLLIKHNAKIDCADNEGITPLMNKAMDVNTNSVEIFKYLLDNGANINARAKDGKTALIFAAKNGHPQAVRALIDAGADIGIADAMGNTVLSYAASLGMSDTVSYLKEKGAKESGFHIVAPKNPPPPISPAQAWALSIPAIYFLEAGHQQLVLQRIKDPDGSVGWQRKGLKLHWGIDSHDSLLRVLDNLRKEGHRSDFLETAKQISAIDDAKFESYLNGPLVRNNQKNKLKSIREGYIKWKDRLALAFDLCRYANLVCKGYWAEFLTEQEAWDLLQPVARTLQKSFNSWQELGENFINGRRAWMDEDEATTDNKFQIMLQLLLNPKDPNSPWNTVPWNTDLSGAIITPDLHFGSSRIQQQPATGPLAK